MYLSVDMHRTQIGLMGVCRIFASSFDMANATRNEAYLSEGLLCKALHAMQRVIAELQMLLCMTFSPTMHYH